MADLSFNLADIIVVYPAVVKVTDGDVWKAYTQRTDDGQIEVVIDAKGTACEVNIYGGTFEVSIDDGAFVEKTSTGGQFNVVSLFTGLTDTWHKIVLKDTNVTLNKTATFTVHGSAPEMRQSAWYGNSFCAYDQLTHILTRGAIVPDSQYLALVCPERYWDFGYTFKTTGPSTGIRIFGYTLTGPCKFDVYIDSILEGQFAFNGNFTSQEAISGLDPGPHTIELRKTDDALSNNCYLITINVIGGELDTSYTPTYGTRVAAVGDSITQNSSSDAPSSAASFVEQIALLKSWTAINVGLSGSYCPASNSDVVANIILSARPKYITVYYGSNEFLNSISVATFKANMLAFIAKLYDGTTKYPVGLKKTTTEKIFLLSPLPWLADQSEDFVTAYTEILNEANLRAGGPDLVLIPTAGQAGFSGFTTLHPTNAQQQFLGEYLSGLMATDFELGAATQRAADSAENSRFPWLSF